MKLLITSTILVLSSFSSHKLTEQVDFPQSRQPSKTWKFATKPYWSDEFNKDGKPDANKWGYDIGGNGWGNNELQYYTAGENAEVKNGKLIITARKEKKDNSNYTSTRMVTKGKGDFLYGRIEVSAKLPTGVGTWPAIWMLPTKSTYGSWPASGEIDIMEHVGYDQNKVHQSVHTQAFNHVINTQKTAFEQVPTASTAFHIYRIDWTPDGISGYIDKQKAFEFLNDGKGFESWPFDKPFHLLLNIAVGGNWGGVKGVDDKSFPASMEVDYVRVYKLLE